MHHQATPPYTNSTLSIGKKLRSAAPVRHCTLPLQNYDPPKRGSCASTLDKYTYREKSTVNQSAASPLRVLLSPPLLLFTLDLSCKNMCVESDGCEIEGCSSSDEVRTLSGSMSPALTSSPDLHPCTPGQKFRAALLRCRTPTAAAGILTIGNILNYMDRYTVVGKTLLLFVFNA